MSQSDSFAGVRAFTDPATAVKERYGHTMRRTAGGLYTLEFYDFIPGWKSGWHWVDQYYDASDVADAAEYIVMQGYKVRVEWETADREESITIQPYDLDTLNAELRGEL